MRPGNAARHERAGCQHRGRGSLGRAGLLDHRRCPALADAAACRNARVKTTLTDGDRAKDGVYCLASRMEASMDMMAERGRAGGRLSALLTEDCDELLRIRE